LWCGHGGTRADPEVFLGTCVAAAIVIYGVEITLAAPKVVGAILVVLFALMLIAWLFLRLRRSVG
jgi:hypothetical protein